MSRQGLILEYSSTSQLPTCLWREWPGSPCRRASPGLSSAAGPSALRLLTSPPQASPPPAPAPAETGPLTWAFAKEKLGQLNFQKPKGTVKGTAPDESQSEVWSGRRDRAAEPFAGFQEAGLERATSSLEFAEPRWRGEEFSPDRRSCSINSFTWKGEGFFFKCSYYRFCTIFIKIGQIFNLGTIYQLTLSTERGSILWISKTLETICAALFKVA